MTTNLILPPGITLFPQSPEWTSFVISKAHESKLPDSLAFAVYQTHLKEGETDYDSTILIEETQAIANTLEEYLNQEEGLMSFSHIMAYGLVMALRNAYEEFGANGLQEVVESFVHHASIVKNLVGNEFCTTYGDGLDQLAHAPVKYNLHLDNFFGRYEQ